MKKHIAILSTLVLLQSLCAQEKWLTIEDAVLRQRTVLAPERLNQLMWVPGKTALSYVAKKGNEEVLVSLTLPYLKADTFLSVKEVYSSLYAISPDEKKMERFPAITWVTATSFRYFYGQAFYLYDMPSKETRMLVKTPKSAEDIDFEPATNRVAYTVNNNVLISDLSGAADIDNLNDVNTAGVISNKKDLITNDGGYGLVNGKAVHRNEFGINKGMFWSPHGNKLAFYKMMESSVSDYSLMDFSKQPSANKNIKYPMAGASSHTVKIFIKDLKRDRLIEVQTGAPAEQYLTNIAWSPDEQYLYVAVVNRAYTEMKMNLYDGNTGVFIKNLFSETHTKYVEPEKPVYFFKNDNRRFVWMSERDGFNNLYLYDSRGELQKQLTKGRQHISEIIGSDPKGTMLVYSAYSEDGMNKYVYTLDLKTLKTLQLTKVEGVHTVLLDENAAYLIDQFSSTGIPRRIVVMDTKGREYGSILNAVNPIAAYVPVQIRTGNIKAADKVTPLNYRMILPANFDEGKKYPVLVYVYGGPHAQMVTNTWLAGADMWLLYMAQQGYVVFTLDNRGSMNRGYEFEAATFRNLGKAELADQMEGVAFLKQQKFVDATRLGVYGWSFGGFMSTGMMTKTPDVFKVGVAGGPVIDWRMYEIMYTERYMDMPAENPDGYKEADLKNFAKNLKGRLMLIHGTSDDVVLWQHSLSFVKKCVDEGVSLDYFVYPGHAHNVLGPDRVHLMKKISQYFKDFL